ncbi:hypothetical protein AB5I41_19130 [Sphingomonas sp. MMS24-JH45]
MKGMFGAIAIAVGVAACLSPASAQMGGSQWVNAKPGNPVPYSAGTPVPPKLLKRIGKDDGSRVQRVVIPFFQVQFVTGSKKSSNREWASLSQSYTLDGLPVGGAVQAIADDLYATFVTTLKARGVSVIQIDQAKAASPNLAKLLSKAQPAPFDGKTGDGATSTFVTAKRLPLYFHISDPERGSMANIGSRAYWDQPAAAKELGAALVGVRIAVNFVEQKSSDKRGLLGIRSSKAKVDSQVTMTVEPISTHLWIAGPTRQAGIVGQPVEPTRYILTSPLTTSGDSVLSSRIRPRRARSAATPSATSPVPCSAAAAGTRTAPTSSPSIRRASAPMSAAR